MHKNSLFLINLQLFAEGGAAAGGDGTGSGTSTEGTLATSTKGAKSNPLANVQYGIQDEAQGTAAQAAAGQETVADDRAARFEELIKGEFKDLYDARMQDTIQRRLKSSKDTVDKYNALTPILDLLRFRPILRTKPCHQLLLPTDEDFLVHREHHFLPLRPLLQLAFL